MSGILKVLLISLLLLKAGSSFSQAVDPFYLQLVNQVSPDTILANLQKLESLGRKEPGSAPLNLTADWLISKYQSFGYTDIVRDTFQYSAYQLYNLVITKPGTIDPPQYLIICGHYDTYHGPGVNDNGSGVATILEVARIISEIPTTRTIKFINFSAEEQGLIGSAHYVSNTVVPSGLDIALVFNIDEVGGVAGMVNNTITCERDEASPASNNAVSWHYTDTLVNLTQMYSELQTHISYAYGSDYVPFQQAGKIIIGFYETNESAYPHTVNDNLINMSPEYVTQIAKASTAASLYFSGAVPVNTVNIGNIAQDMIKVFPNPAAQRIYWELPAGTAGYVLKIYDAAGKLLLERVYTSGEDYSADLSSFKSGLLALKFELQGNLGSTKIVKILKK